MENVMEKSGILLFGSFKIRWSSAEWSDTDMDSVPLHQLPPYFFFSDFGRMKNLSLVRPKISKRWKWNIHSTPFHSASIYSDPFHSAPFIL